MFELFMGLVMLYVMGFVVSMFMYKAKNMWMSWGELATMSFAWPYDLWVYIKEN